MFKRRVVILIILLILAISDLVWKWNDIPGVSVATGTGSTSTQRFTMDLQGAWNVYPSLRQAWVTESERLTQQKPEYPLTKGQPVILPSTQKFHVAVRDFEIPSEWSARNVSLQLQGVYGKGTVYLNGIESANRIGDFAGDGERQEFLIPATALRYGEKNLLLIEISAPPLIKNTVLGFSWPVKGQITGSLRLIATMKTSLAMPKINVRWDGENALVTVQTRLIHHGFSESGPWNVQGVISDGSAEIAAVSTQVQPDENPVQPVNLTFTIPHAHRWNTADPFLYQFYLTVTNPQGDQDDLAFPLGLTSLSYQQGKFVLNGQALPIKGIVLEPQLEAQVRHEGKVKLWLEEQKKHGYNLVYFLGGFPDEIWLRAADEAGIGIWAELPASLIPATRLPDPASWQDSMIEMSEHPSIWALTAGKGLEVDQGPRTAGFWKGVQQISQSLPVFMARITEKPWLDPNQSLQLTSKGLQGSWGQVDFTKEPVSASSAWPEERRVAELWGTWVLIVTVINIGTVSWRYKELQSQKPKRPLRRAWFWQGLSVLSRQGTLAGILISLLFQTQLPWETWFSGQWPAWELLKRQSPFLLWFILTLFLVLVRLFQVGVAAPSMPESPPMLGLTLWLERRYRWSWIPAVLWAAEPWGVPGYLPLAAYAGFTLLFLPLRIRDVHKVGGKYCPFILVPGMVYLAFLAWAMWRWADFYYLWQLILGLTA